MDIHIPLDFSHALTFGDYVLLWVFNYVIFFVFGFVKAMVKEVQRG